MKVYSLISNESIRQMSKKMMLLIAFDFYFDAFLLQSSFEDHQVANLQPLSTESSYAIKDTSFV